jgi:hypothetical protein
LVRTEEWRKGYRIRRRPHAYLSHLKAEGLIAGCKITHRKPGLDPIESFQHTVNSLVKGPFSRSTEISRISTMSAARSIFNPLRAKREGSSGGYSILNWREILTPSLIVS